MAVKSYDMNIKVNVKILRYKTVIICIKLFVNKCNTVLLNFHAIDPTTPSNTEE